MGLPNKTLQHHEEYMGKRCPLVERSLHSPQSRGNSPQYPVYQRGRINFSWWFLAAIAPRCPHPPSDLAQNPGLHVSSLLAFSLSFFLPSPSFPSFLPLSSPSRSSPLSFLPPPAAQPSSWSNYLTGLICSLLCR